jgi:predicted kinase
LKSTNALIAVIVIHCIKEFFCKSEVQDIPNSDALKEGNQRKRNVWRVAGKITSVIIIVCGLPGSGKSFFAAKLARMLNSGYVNSDAVRKQLVAEKTYSDKEKLAVYDAMLQQMNLFTDQNKNVVLDGTFYKKEIREQFKAAAKDKATIIFIEVKATEYLIRERVQKSRPGSDADFEVYKKLKKEWERLEEEHLVLQSTNENLWALLNTAVAYIQLKDDKRTN